MRVRKADNLTPRSEQHAAAGGYGPNSLVFYQKDEGSQGFAYRAKPTYEKSKKPPDEDSNWAIDYTFFSPWSEKAKYEEGARVYYFNGANTYGYKATVRYFGGNGRPNEEVDNDNIRTWELDFQYGNESSLPTEFLVPVKKVTGYYNGKVNSFIRTDPEERPFTSTINWGEGGIYIFEFNALIVNYLFDKGIMSREDYKEVNSIYQSFPYDRKTYNFFEDKPDNNFKLIKRRSGIHFAKWRSQTSREPYFKNGVSQAKHTLYASFDEDFYYYRKHGFSIEMWPNVSDDDYELIPTAGLSTYGFGVFDSPDSRTVPAVGFGVSWNYFYEPVDGISLSDGVNPEDAKLNAFFYRNIPAFDGRSGDVNFIKEYFPPQTNPNIIPVPSYSFFSQTLYSYETSFVYETNGSLVRSKEDGNPLDLGNHMPSSGFVSIAVAGTRYD
jgi:hypothetical protein